MRKRPRLAGLRKPLGRMPNIHDLKAAYEQAIGHPTRNRTIYNVLNRRDWRKLAGKKYPDAGGHFRSRSRAPSSRRGRRPGSPAACRYQRVSHQPPSTQRSRLAAASGNRSRFRSRSEAASFAAVPPRHDHHCPDCGACRKDLGQLG